MTHLISDAGMGSLLTETEWAISPPSQSIRVFDALIFVSGNREEHLPAGNRS